MPFNTPRKTALGRADLLQMLAEHADAGSERQIALADILGFEFSPKSVEPEPVGAIVKGRGFATKPTIRIGPSQLPRGLFRPLYAQYLEVAAGEEQWQARTPQGDYGVLTDDDQAAWDKTASRPPLQPLVPWTRLWPRLHQSVTRSRPAGLDVERLVRMLAQAKTVPRLPRKIRQTWPVTLHLILDFSDRLTPYWDDWHWLARKLGDLLKTHLMVSVLYRSDATVLHAWPAKDGAQTRPWPQASTEQTLLIASDLGQLDSSRPNARHNWQRRLQAFRRQGISCLIAAPLAHSQLVAETANLAPLIRLSPDNSLRPTAQLSLLHQACAPDERDPAYRLLLTWLAMATRVEPGLLRALRQSLPTQADNAGLEGALWLDKRLNTAPGACAFSEEAAAEWQKEFSKRDPDLQQRLLDCLRRYHAYLPQMIHHEETLLWSRVAGGELAAAEGEHRQNALRFFHKLTQSLQTEDAGPYRPAERHLLLNIADHHLQHAAASLSGEDYLNRLSVAVSRSRPSDTKPLPDGLDWCVWLQSQPDMIPSTMVLLQRYNGTLVMLHPTESIRELGWQRLLTLNLDRQVLLWSLQIPGQPKQYRPWYWLQHPLLHNEILQVPNGSLDPSDANELWLHTGRQQICLNRFQAPAWAKEWGVDRFGLYADLDFGSVTQRFRWIEPGNFMMGSPPFEPERSDTETQHVVTLTKGFWFADSACTQALWQAVMGNNPSRFNDDPNKPVENVSWLDAQTFITVLNRQISGLNARLPSEAEWEYACRACTEKPFSFGDNITPDQVNYNGQYPYANGEKGEYRETTVAVKSLPVNAWGLYEMHGNIWEWCQDGWQEDLGSEDVVDPLFDPQEQGLGRVLRGGSWNRDGRYVRSAMRFSGLPDDHSSYVGFRLALG